MAFFVFIPHGETDRKSTFRIRLGMNKVRGLTQMIEILLSHLLLFHSITSNHVFNQPALGESIPKNVPCARDDKTVGGDKLRV